MDQCELVRTAKRVYGKSIRKIARDTGHHRVTIRKALSGEEPKYRRRKRVKCRVMDAVAGVVEQAITSVLVKHCPSYESIRLVVRLQESSPLVTQPLPAELLAGVTDRAFAHWTKGQVCRLNRYGQRPHSARDSLP